MTSAPPPRGSVPDDDLSAEPVAMSLSEAKALSTRLKALADPTRVRLLMLVAAHEGAEASVADLVEPMGLSQPTVSHHLKILVHAGLLSRAQRGSWSSYSVVPGAVDALADLLRTSLGRLAVRREAS